ncbi:MAG: 2Fe-2S iron-sulfur cluster binding domain-containing protein [Desulfobacterales bacterium]|nr:2Fe-2S iron-sulfur cluster binding domain-containing protein [Desulfobacterales bacterium]
MEALQKTDLIPVYFYGKRYDVPKMLTVLQAFEFVGYQFIRGCGCRGGVCGACAAVYIHPESHHLEVALACQMKVLAGMRIIQVPYFPVDKPGYNIDALNPTTEQVGQIYPQIYRCVACNTCTKMCPQDINVMGCISMILRGDIEGAAAASRDCVMCGLCTSRCPAEIPQFLIFLLARRLDGRFIQKPFRFLPTRLERIAAGDYEAELNALMTMDIEVLKVRYQKQQQDKQII